MTTVSASSFLSPFALLAAFGWPAVVLSVLVIVAAMGWACVARRRSRWRQPSRDLPVVQTGVLAPPFGTVCPNCALVASTTGVAHDFNNLLVSIMANAELLRLSLIDDQSQQYAADIIECAEAATKLTRQLSVLTCDLSSPRSVVDLNCLVNSSLLGLRARLRATHELCVSPTRNPLWVAVNAAQIEQILANLVLNAADASPVGSTIEIRSGRAETDRGAMPPFVLGDRQIGGRFAYIEVTDHGTGMEPQWIDQAFQPLRSSKGAGRGLGLSIVLRCVNEHDGLVVCQTKPGRGTNMRVLLPEMDHSRTTSERSSSQGGRDRFRAEVSHLPGPSNGQHGGAASVFGS